MPRRPAPEAKPSEGSQKPKPTKSVDNKPLASVVGHVKRFFHRSPNSRLQISPSQAGTSQSSMNLQNEEALHPGDTRLPLERSPNRSQDSVSPQPPTAYAIPQPAAAAFEGAHDFNISGNTQFLNIGKQKTVNNYTGTYGLDILKEFVSHSALHDSSAQDPQRKCHPGTRENVLRQMRNWIDNSAAEPILWMHGPAGVGKSAIAQTIAHSYNQDKVAATFFFFRSDTTRNDGNRLIPTLAWQLSFSTPEVRDLVARSLNENPDIPRKAIEIQFERLIAQPLLAIFHIQTPTPVVIIDGLDECSDDVLQQRIIETLGKAVGDNCLPLRFLISSRPEAHIRDGFDKFKSMILKIDLAEIDDAHNDIETYLKAEFARIATEQAIDIETWPIQEIIQGLVSKSSGQFVYASTVIKFVGDRYSSAPSQLDIVLGLEPSDGESPFADLDALYIEILERQRHQEFLKEFLTVLVARSGNSRFSGRDDPLLLNVERKVLHRKLRGMHALLKIEPESDIEIHHRSFLDFLQDPSRSSQYHVSTQHGARRYMELIVGSTVRCASRAMKQSPYHGAEHLTPAFAEAIRCLPRPTELCLEDWEEALQPLLRHQDDMLKLPDFNSQMRRVCAEQCTTFYIIDDLLLHLSFFHGTSHPKTSVNFQDQEHGDMPTLVPADNLDGCLASLLDILENGKFPLPVRKDVACLTHALLQFDPAEVARKVQSMSDAQNLIDFIYHLMRNKSFLDANCAMDKDKAVQLALELYTKIPLLPQFLVLDRSKYTDDTDDNYGQYQGMLVRSIGFGGGYSIAPLCQCYNHEWTHFSFSFYF